MRKREETRGGGGRKRGEARDTIEKDTKKSRSVRVDRKRVRKLCVIKERGTTADYTTTVEDGSPISTENEGGHNPGSSGR